MRIGLGCLRLEDVAGTLREAVTASVPWLDTARAYPGSEEAIAAHVPAGALRIVTKCGMKPGWVPDGRAGAILADARASVAALGRVPDLLLLHAPDPTVDLRTSARALARAQREGLARAIGLSNVTRGQLEQVAEIVPIAAVENALGAYADGAARGGVLSWCREHGALFFAHSPLGGPDKVARVRRDGVLRAIAERHGTTPEVVMLAYLLTIDDVLVPLVGARTPAQLHAALAAEKLALTVEDREALAARFPGLTSPPPPPSTPRAEVVLLMGVAGSGKSRLAADWVARGYLRLNRDEIGGTLRGIAKRLGDALARGERRIVLDNTYLTRAVRSDVLRVAHAGGAVVRCIHVTIAASDAQRNLAERMLARHGALLGDRALAAAKGDPGLFAPTTLARMLRELEPPGADEGFVAIESVPFVRQSPEGVAAVLVPLEVALAVPIAAAPDAPLLVFGWQSTGDDEVLRTALAAKLERRFSLAICRHAAGPPTCWCRPPLPGLAVAFARAHGVDLRASVLLSRTTAHETLAATLGCQVRTV